MTPKKKSEENSAANTELAAKEKALKLREALKHKRPDFVRQESWRYKRIKENWRRPRGLDSKMRRKIKGWPKCPEVGYRGPKAARGLHPSGYEEILVYNPNDLDKVDPEKQAIRIAHTVGIKKRMEIIAKATSKKIRILNPKEAELELEEEREKLEAEEEEELEEEKAKIEEAEKEEGKKERERAKTRKTKKRKKAEKGEEK
ncbi:50S ribosomal protein L32e [Candidatus Bathyarchaeota archaeon]|nr:50S ribosomal protein L32e [Candidatus Bathyarchaeota archaeon]